MCVKVCQTILFFHLDNFWNTLFIVFQSFIFIYSDYRQEDSFITNKQQKVFRNFLLVVCGLCVVNVDMIYQSWVKESSSAHADAAFINQLSVSSSFRERLLEWQLTINRRIHCHTFPEAWIWLYELFRDSFNEILYLTADCKMF